MKLRWSFRNIELLFQDSLRLVYNRLEGFTHASSTMGYLRGLTSDFSLFKHTVFHHEDHVACAGNDIRP